MDQLSKSSKDWVCSLGQVNLFCLTFPLALLPTVVGRRETEAPTSTWSALSTAMLAVITISGLQSEHLCPLKPSPQCENVHGV